MKVLLISDYGYLAGGAELIMVRLRAELRRHGHQVRLFTSDAGDPGQEILADDTCLGTQGRFRTLLQTANPWAARRLQTLISEFRPDLVHVRMFLTQLSPLILPALKSVPSIYHVAWYRPICPTGSKMLPGGEPCRSSYGRICHSNGCLPLRDWAPLMLQMRMLRRWRHHFDLVVANSQAVGRSLEAEGIGPVEVVYNGIPIAAPPKRPTFQPTVSFVGRLVPEKGVILLLDAFEHVLRKMPEARLVIAGDGPERGPMERRVVARGMAGKVQFLGYVEPDVQAKELRAAGLQVLPSVWAEPFGITAVEAMMRGQAVVASNHGGLAEIILDGKTGALVPPRDEFALAKALLRLLRNPEETARMGLAGYQRAVTMFSLETFSQRFLTCYERLLNQSG